MPLYTHRGQRTLKSLVSPAMWVLGMRLGASGEERGRFFLMRVPSTKTGDNAHCKAGSEGQELADLKTLF